MPQASLLADLRQLHIERCLLKSLHELTDQLQRLAAHGMFFVQDSEAFFKHHCEPLIDRLLGCLRQTYGPDHATLKVHSVQDLSALIRGLGPVVETDLAAALDNDPAAHDPLEVMFCYPGFQAVFAHRIAHVFHKHGLPLLPRMIAERAHERTGIDIHPGAQIGDHFFIDHGSGVVIGETCIIGHHVTLYQGVTLGAKRFQRDEHGRIVKGQPRHPVLGDRVTVYSGASILGRIEIGSDSVIGGNVWLTESVPSHSRISQQRYQSSFFKDGDGI